MSYQEKRSIVSMLSTILITAAYFFYILHGVRIGSLDPANVFRFWGWVILILIPVSIVARIIIYIVFSIVHTMATKECDPPFNDERDKLIGLKATRNAHWVFVVGFLLAMVSQVAGMAPSVMFMVLIGFGFVSDLAGEISQLYFYRQGV
jgi:hypothetical protein